MYSVMGLVYRITVEGSGVYIGSTVMSLCKRLSFHKVIKGLSPCDWSVEVLEESDCWVGDLRRLEQKWIDQEKGVLLNKVRAVSDGVHQYHKNKLDPEWLANERARVRVASLICKRNAKCNPFHKYPMI